MLAATTNLRDSKRDIRKSKRLPGEDDTDRDLRYAKERAGAEESSDKSVVRLRPTRNNDADAPIIDRKGNINLFPEIKPDAAKTFRQSEKEREKERQTHAEENYGMHLKDVWGRKDPSGTWYMDKDGVVKDSAGTDVWGNEDPRRRERQVQRVTSSDPLAFMKRAQKQLKEVHRERSDREAELEEFRSRRSRDKGGLDGFSLDELPVSQVERQTHKDDRRYNHGRNRIVERAWEDRRRKDNRSRSPSRSHRRMKDRPRSRSNSRRRYHERG